MAVKDIDDIVFEIVQDMDVNVKVKTATAPINETQRITLCDIKYTRLMTVLFEDYINEFDESAVRDWSIDVNSFDEDGSFVVLAPGSNLALSPGSVLRLKRPYYFRGTPLATNKEWLVFSEDHRTKLPMIWLVQPTTETWYGIEDSRERESRIRVFFLAEADFANDFTKDHRVKQVVPLLNMVEVFVDHVKDSGAFSRKFEYTTRDFSRFGSENENGIVKNIIDANLSGVELKMPLTTYRQNCDC